jgi:nucleoside-diphosphate-sugar epimerase
MTGAGGMIGQKLAHALAARRAVNGRAIEALWLHDLTEPPAVPGLTCHRLRGDLRRPDVTAALAALKCELVFHLAGIVSAQAEAELDLGYGVNLDGTRGLFDAIRAVSPATRIVFASSIAVFGGPFPDTIPDDFHPTPRTSYGTQKLMAELLLADYSRRGLLDGVGVRLPTICVRPGLPNKAASSFFSSIIREPLAGRRVALPVPREVLHTHASPRSAVNFLIRAAEIDSAVLGGRPNLTMPGVACTVGAQIEALGRVAGARFAGMIDDVPDAAVWAIVRHWPTKFDARRARDLGFAAETGFDEIIRIHIEDELGGNLPA